MIKYVEGQTDDTLFLEPRPLYDSAILRCNSGVLVYSADKIIQLLIEDWSGQSLGLDQETLEQDAMDYYYFNIEAAYMGAFTPIYEWSIEEGE